MSIDKEDDSFLWKLLLVIHKGVDNDNPGHNVQFSASNIQLLRPINGPVSECTPWIELCIYLFALSAYIFLVLNLPVPIGRLTPTASSIFNIVSSVTLLSPWSAGFPCVRQEGVSVHHTTSSSCFFFFFFFFVVVFLNVLIKPILMGFTQSQCQTAVQTTVLDRFVFKLGQRSSVLYRKMKVTFQTLLLLLSTVKL